MEDNDSIGGTVQKEQVQHSTGHKHIVLQLLLTHQLVIIVDALHFKIVVGLY